MVVRFLAQRRPAVRVSALARTGYALLVASATTSLLGLAYWAVAARRYTPETVGHSAALLSALLLVSGVTSLGMNQVVIRFVPRAGRSTGTVILGTYAVAAVTGLVAGFALGLANPRFLSLDNVFGNHVLRDAGLFAAATAVWSFFTIQDSVLASIRAAVWVPIENGLYAVAKLILVAALAATATRAGIVISWLAPLAVLVAAVSALLVVRLVPRHVAATGYAERAPDVRAITRYAAGNWTSSLFATVATTVVPLLVVDRAGAREGAYFYVPWTLMTGLALIAASLTISMTIHGSFDELELAENARRAVRHIAAVLVPAVLVIAIGAPLILRAFSAAYSEHGTTVLRLLVVSTLPIAAINVGIAAARVEHRMPIIVGSQLAACVAALAGAWLLLPSHGIAGAALAWLLAQAVVAVAMIPYVVRVLR